MEELWFGVESQVVLCPLMGQSDDCMGRKPLMGGISIGWLKLASSNSHCWNRLFCKNLTSECITAKTILDHS
jgi:hypothetical protein